MESKAIINLIDYSLEEFWNKPSTAKIEGQLSRENLAKYYLMGKGLTDEEIETYADKIRSKLALLSDKDKNPLPTPPTSPPDGASNASDCSYQGPGQFFRRLTIWIKDREECDAATCSFHDDEEHIISQTMINCLEAPVQDEIALLRWSPDQSNVTYRTRFRVVATELAEADVMLGKDWWKDPKREEKYKTSTHADAKGKHSSGEMKGGNRNKICDERSVRTTSTNKSRGGHGHRKPSKVEALTLVGKALMQIALDDPYGSSSESAEFD